MDAMNTSLDKISDLVEVVEKSNTFWETILNNLNE
jgi:hypothetical protein